MSNDWSVPCSDDEDNPNYMPLPEKIVSLYSILNDGETLDLMVEIVPRKQLNKKETELAETDNVTTKDIEVKEEEIVPDSEPNEFDFDSQATDPIKKFVPKRTPTRNQTKKVARMDKVCSNIIKYQKLDEAQLKLDKSNKES